jgi:glycosyltransferase involved in cell wall biosynthesis
MALEIVTALVTWTDTVVVLRTGGPLAPEFDRIAPCLVREPLSRVRAGLRRWRATKTLANRLEQRVAGRVLRRHAPSLVYLNTVKSACYLRPALQLRIPVVLHVHELEPLASTTLARYASAEQLGRVALVACSEPVRRNLVAISGVDRDDITLLPNGVDVGRVVAKAGRPAASNEPVVGACGTVDARKGTEQWLDMVSLLRRQQPDRRMRFVWVGALADPTIMARVRELEVRDYVDFVGEQENSYALLASMDVFTHPARDDPFPLAVLEAMALARPVVAFDVGGVRDELADAGVLVPPGDTDAMAREVARLLANPVECRRLGEAAARRVRENFGIEQFREQVIDLVATALATGEDQARPR